MAALRAYRAPPEIVACAAPAGTFALLEANFAPLRVFCAAAGQWRASGAGLDYVALAQVAAWLGAPMDARTFAAVRVMEAEALRLARGENISPLTKRP